jgi:glutamyl-tRNA(Gln) amidotransferase subunit E
MISIKNIDYKKIGLKCGLELHQQLDTNKLFCNCSSVIIKDNTKPDKIIKRKLFARTSESGEVDFSANIEQEKNKTFIYNVYNSCNCLVETDSQPPFNINQKALEIACVISLLTNSCFVDSSQVMRKQVIDGSNVSGFQRTLMVSTDGFLEYDFGKVRINKILLEEDSARPIKETDTQKHFSLDRQGTPLIELVVWHDIHTPEDVKKVALDIGTLFRRTCNVKRGLGTIRQDINISIKKGARVEIKGTQDLDLIPEIVKREVIRQLSLIDLKKHLQKNNIKYSLLSYVDISDIFKETKCLIIKNALKKQQKVYGFKIKDFKNILGTELQPNRRVGTEIASILKKQTNVKGIIHYDELPNYNLYEKDIAVIKKKLNVTNNDSFILVTCDSKEITTVSNIINKRYKQLFEKVPEETRIITPEGNTEYQRPLSSGARMYPETDLEPIVFSKSLITSAKQRLPKTVEERKKLYINKYKLNEQLANKMKLSNYAVIFENILEISKVNPTTLCVFLLEDLKRLFRDDLELENEISKENIKAFFINKEANKIPRSKLIDGFLYFINNDYSMSKTITHLKLNQSKDVDVNKLITEIIIENKDFIIKQKQRSVNFVVGQVMSKTKGVANPKEVLNIVSKKIDLFLKSL